MYQIYQIMAGDTVESISSKLGISPMKLREINGLSEGMNLRVGNYLIIPVTNQSGFQTYVVKKGDSLYSIAQDYNMDYNTLALLNGLKEGEYIYPNQELMVPINNERVYVVKQNDTVISVLNKTGITLDELINKNENIYLMEDQVIKY